MKTVEEAAMEYAQKTDKANAEWVCEDFIAGVKFAQQWISVEKELPKRNEFEEYSPLLVLDRYGNYFTAFFREKYKVFGTVNPDKSNVIGEVAFVTHWRPIELK